MIDFSKYMSSSSPKRRMTLLETYHHLDRRTSHAGDPRPQQRAAMEALDSRADSSCSVVRLGTGSGKTVVGLTYLHQKQRESTKPVVYLCPTVQLVDQVLEEASKIGVGAVAYRGKERHPDAAAVAGEKVLVCTYAKLFNGRSTFNHDDVSLRPFAMVLDDAHVGGQEIRKCFCVRIEGALFAQLHDVLSGACKSVSASEAERIANGDPATLMELPYWAWQPLAGEVRGVIESTEGDHKFAWENIRDHLPLCRCVLSGRAVELFPDAPLVSTNAAYLSVRHRLFMSATLPDEGALVRDLGCEPDAVLHPIQPDRGVGIGERMVIAPSLVDTSLTEDWVIAAATALAKQVRVVALCSTGGQLEKWKIAGATAELGSDAAEAVRALQRGEIRFAALAQRYDGVDLPDDACRVLVVDGIPRGQGLGDSLDAGTGGYPGGQFTRWAFRLEQGLGRAVRSESDYCVVLLSGHDLASFVGKHEVREGFSSGTQTQLRLTRELADIAKAEGKAPESAVWDLIQAALTRDEGWRAYYKNKMGLQEPTLKVDALAVRVSESIRQATALAASRRCPEAANAIAALLREHDEKAISLPDDAYGWLLQMKAFLTHAFNPADALKMQAAAYQRNHSLLAPPTGVTLRTPKLVEQGAVVLAWYQQFEDGNAALAEFAGLRSRLSFSVSATMFEQALKEFSALLGAQGERPEKEYGRGPDNAIFWPTHDWILEAKTQKTNSVLSKGDGEQLLAATEWYSTNYPERKQRMTPIFVANTTASERDAYFPAGSHVLNEGALGTMITRVDVLLGELCGRLPSAWTASEVGKLLEKAGLVQHALTPLLTAL